MVTSPGSGFDFAMAAASSLWTDVWSASTSAGDGRVFFFAGGISPEVTWLTTSRQTR